ncbi:MAG: F0F1 ATP synthase subunit A [Christensenellales bacterium]|jgi:F-type H+-transporting ATPase subunit a|nr:F0F1 ATP synthase subunit A [Clostridiales bacterium]
MTGIMIGGVGERLTQALLPQKIEIFKGFFVGPSMFTAFGVTLFLLLVCLVLRLTVVRKMKNIPSKPQMILEGLVKFFDKLAHESTHEYSGFMGPYIMAAACFISVGTLVELLGVRPAFADINACFALGISTFLVIHYFGIRKRGIGKRAKRLLNPINIITDVAVPISLSFRLFGSIVSGFLITELLYSSLYLSFALPAVVSVITTLFHAFIQSYIFITLSSLFVGEAIEVPSKPMGG